MKIYTTLGLIAPLMLSIIGTAEAQQPRPDPGLAPEAINQMNALRQEKASRTPAQRKIDSALLYALKRKRHDPLLNQVPELSSTVEIAADGTTLVDIKATVTDELLNQIEGLGGTVINSFPQYNAIRASISLDQIEALAALPEVRSIRQADKPMLNKINTSEGDLAHRANEARATFGVNGTGIKIGVLSDSVDALASLQASGDLPAVTVLPGQSGNPGSSEGTAMLEIVHDLAPGAQLFFATAFNGPASFAQNILNLRTAGCDIIVDDITYFAEGAFQDDIISQAVNTVTASGALYFSSAGNSGNLNDGTSGVWEGDYVPTTIPASIPNFGYLDAQNFGGGQNFNTVTRDPSYFSLQWSDPLGASTNDYDLFLLNAAGTAVLGGSTGNQTGTQDPYEQIDSPANDVNNRLVIVRFAGSPRFMRLNTGRGRLQIATAGQTWGHNAAKDAFTTAATVWNACGGTPLCTTAPVETFSSDGPRKIFYNPDGTPITPGNFLSTGGTVRPKPDITAADGVSTATPGFNPFFGTSAAAPHAAAIAGLMLSVNRSLLPAQMRTRLTSNTWDIEAPGVDRDSGAGIINAFAAVQAVPSTLLAGLTATTNGLVYYTTNLNTWVYGRGQLNRMVVGDFDGDGQADDLAGIASNDTLWYTTNGGTSWTNIPGRLNRIVVGNFDGDNRDDLAGIASNNTLWYTTNLGAVWNNIPGLLSQMVVSDFDGDGRADDFAGIASNNTIWYTTTFGAVWNNIPGLLSKMVAGDFDGDGRADDLAGIASNSTLWYTTNLSAFSNIPGLLSQMVAGDFDGDGRADDLAGIASNSTVWYTTNLGVSWTNIPGALSQIRAASLNGDSRSDLAGVASNNTVWYTTNLSTFTNIPGQLATLAGD